MYSIKIFNSSHELRTFVGCCVDDLVSSLIEFFVLRLNLLYLHLLVVVLHLLRFITVSLLFLIVPVLLVLLHIIILHLLIPAFPSSLIRTYELFYQVISRYP
jgi:hypothetical protein